MPVGGFSLFLRWLLALRRQRVGAGGRFELGVGKIRREPGNLRRNRIARVADHKNTAYGAARANRRRTQPLLPELREMVVGRLLGLERAEREREPPLVVFLHHV